MICWEGLDEISFWVGAQTHFRRTTLWTGACFCMSCGLNSTQWSGGDLDFESLISAREMV